MSKISCVRGNGYRTVGKGTAELAEYAPGKMIELLTGLGNGFDTSRCGDKPLLIGGGVMLFYLLVCVLPLIRLLQLPPAQLAAKYDM